SSCAETAELGGAPLSANPSGDMLSTSAPIPKGPARCSSLESPLCRQSRLACHPCWPSAAASRPSSCQVCACASAVTRSLHGESGAVGCTCVVLQPASS